MQADVWYDLVLLELAGTDPLDERLREAEAAQVTPPPKPEAVEETPAS
ncbi:MAG TPA: hypothetical protein VIE37_02190 [Methylomirabilota bacterium]